MFVDDVLVYRGSLRRSPRFADLPHKLVPNVDLDSSMQLSDFPFNWGDVQQPNLSQSIIFSNDPVIVSSEVMN